MIFVSFLPCLFLLLVFFLSASNAFHLNAHLVGRQILTLAASAETTSMRRLKLLDIVKLSANLLVVTSVLSPESCSALDKMSKDAETCLSKCVFEETRPPPLGSNAERLLVQRSRIDIISDCKEICFKTNQSK
jgi:hypothetical protein